MKSIKKAKCEKPFIFFFSVVSNWDDYTLACTFSIFLPCL